jgi:hypothetical protein
MIPDDELSEKLRQAARRRRPWSWGSFFLTLIVFGVPLGVLAWRVWPRTHPPEMMVIAVDQVAVPGSAFNIRAAIEPVERSEKRWGGLDLFFEEVLPNGNQAGDVVKVVTDKYGIGLTVWKLKAPVPDAEIEVRYLDDTVRPPLFDRGRCRVFTYSVGTRLLVADIDPTLRKAGDWPAVAKALSEARNAGWQLAYLAVGAGTPRAYGELREWVVQKLLADEEPLPAGPVLPRIKWFGSESDSVARKQLLAALKDKIRGPVQYVYQDQSLQVQTVGANGELTGEPVAVLEWAKLASLLPKAQ